MDKRLIWSLVVFIIFTVTYICIISYDAMNDGPYYFIEDSDVVGCLAE